MLSRRGSNVSVRPYRSKSSASLGSHQHSPSKSESIDAETAHLHAVAAASTALGRTLQHQGTNGLSRQNSRCSVHSQRGSGLTRQRSVRFAGPHAVPTRRLTKPRSTARTPDAGVASRDATTSTTAGLRRQGSVGPDLDISGALLLDDPTYTPQDGIASAPSSYRRIRKSKSLFAAGEAASRGHRSSFSAETSHGTHVLSNGLQRRERTLKAPRSLSFLRLGSEKKVPPPPPEPSSHAIALAREQHSRNSEEGNEQRQQSFVLTPSARRHQKALRKTVRTGADSKFGPPIASPNQHARPAKKGFSAKARNLSATIKSKLRSVFQRSSNKSEGMPAQQLEASRPHWAFDIGSESPSRSDYLDEGTPKERRLSAITSGMPSIHDISPSMQLRSRAGSVHSAVSENHDPNDKSRVTSWTTSTATNTMAPSLAADIQRLSVIQETTEHNSSMFGHTRSYTNARYAAFRGPMDTGSPKMPGSDPVDSRRVYSALLRRLHENSPEGEPSRGRGMLENGPGRLHLDGQLIPPRSSSIETRTTDGTVRRYGRARHVSDARCHAPFGLDPCSEEDLGGASEMDSQFNRPTESEHTEERSVYDGQEDSPATELRNVVTPHQESFLEDDIVGSSPGAVGIAVTLATPVRSRKYVQTGSDGGVSHDDTSDQGSASTERPFEDRLTPGNQSVAGSASIYSRSASGNHPKAFSSSASLASPQIGYTDELAEYLRSSPENQVDHRDSSGSVMVRPDVSTGADRPIINSRTLTAGKLQESLVRRLTGHRREHSQIQNDEVEKGGNQSFLTELQEKSKGWRPSRYRLRPERSSIRRPEAYHYPLGNVSQLRQRSAAQQNSFNARDAAPSSGGENGRQSALSTSPETQQQALKADFSTVSPNSMASPMGSSPPEAFDRRASFDIFHDHDQSVSHISHALLETSRSVAPPSKSHHTPERARRLAAYRQLRPEGASPAVQSENRHLDRTPPRHASDFYFDDGLIGQEHLAVGQGFDSSKHFVRPLPSSFLGSDSSDALGHDESGGPAFI
ncbi:MAG: Transcriptional regulatory protein sin3 [Watsoniomyces obsoletus]|nr:MAG: Transcriptional regulatory protein sin3 [Watsoniomyces obsoletus]